MAPHTGDDAFEGRHGCKFSVGSVSSLTVAKVLRKMQMELSEEWSESRGGAEVARVGVTLFVVTFGPQSTTSESKSLFLRSLYPVTSICISISSQVCAFRCVPPKRWPNPRCAN